MQDSTEVVLQQLAERVTAAVEALELVLPRLNVAASEAIGPIVATVDGRREMELVLRLDAAEKTIAELRESASTREGRRTLPVSLFAKQDGGNAESGALDAALTSLSLEQRIAVKAQLFRAGLV